MTDVKGPLDDALADWEPETRVDPHTARAQTRRVVEYLREHEDHHPMEELQDTLAPGSTLDQRYWWRHAVWPGLNHLTDHGLVEYVTTCGYQWTGPDQNTPSESSP